MAAANYFDSVQKLYIAFYQRPADSGGLLYWSQRLDAAKGSLEGVVDAFATSAEANTLYGAVDKNTVGTVVDKIYQALFNRTPDEAGKKYYVDGFLAGKFTAGKIALDVLNGATNNDLVAINNKVTVANRFTETVDGRAMTDGDFGVGTVFAATYAGDTDAQAAREILVGVTSNPATMLTASDVAAQVQSKIADQGDAVAGQTSGKTFTLTAGADPITGTAGNDTFNALTIKADGTLATTLGAFDVIDGGAGTDTLNIYSDGAFNLKLDANTTIKNVENINIYNSTAAFNSTAAPAVIDASKLEGVKNINQIGLDVAVTELSDNTVAAYKGGAVGTSVLNVTSTNTATKATVVLDGIAEGDTITFNVPVAAPANGGALSSVIVSGTVADTNLDGAVATTNVGVTVGRDVQSLTVNTAVDTTLAVTDGAGTKKVTTVDASASAGKLTYVAANTVANVSTGKGNDVVTLATAYTATLTAASVNGGEGDDTLNVNVTNAADAAGTTVSAVGGAGKDTINLNITNGATKSVGVTVDAGAGNDTVDVNFAVKTTDSIDGGADADTVAVAGKAARNADDFIVVNKVLKNFETIQFKTAEGAAGTKLDASLLAANYATLDFAAGSFVDNVDAQALVARGNLTAEAKGYVNVGEGTPAATAITYAGTLNITEKLTGTVNAHADTVKLTVEGGKGNGVAPVNATLTGEAKTAVVALSAGTDTKGTVSTTDDVYVASKIVVTTAAGAEGLSALTSLTLSGNGTATITNANNTALVTVDASALNSVDIAGKAATGLVYNTANTKAETIKLGAGLDAVTIAGSTYTVGQTKMDTVEGLNLVVTGGAIDATKGDTLAITGLANLGATGKFTTTQTDLDLALLDAAKLVVSGADVNTVAFHLNGNTYIYQDNVAADDTTNIVDANDILVKLTGTIDLDALVLMV